ncbi:MAG: DUF92 domain-containing protein [Aigarchaeota archaeon]|nr:DUF92 domain-containing protein [Aigarchaeota archaeon]MDW8092125.1 DUF92 domain-containing protein [Nitrososphaerota archaeon]
MTLNSYVLLEATIVISVLGVISYRMRLLDGWGSLSAVLVGYSTYLGIGRVGMVALVTFFLVSSVFTKYKASYKRQVLREEPNDHMRSWRNVWGNGAIPFSLGVMSIADPGNVDLYTSVYLGAISAAFSDTMSTEVGLLYRGRVRYIIGFREVYAGAPGGVTPYGFLGAIFSGCVLFIATSFFASNAKILPYTLVIILVSGLVGTTMDSVAGQLWQRTYRCACCNEFVESSVHCGVVAVPLKGYRLVNTHVVNLICTGSGAVVAFIVWGLL